MRQPHARNASPGAMTAISAMLPEARSRPSGTPICGEAPKRPRLVFGACSTAMSTAPPHSPPAEMPCRMRRRISSMGAADADRLVGGQEADQGGCDAHQHRVSMSTTLRPYLSPK